MRLRLALNARASFGIQNRCPKMSKSISRIAYHGPMESAQLDWRICSRARLARDPRFDGKFFIGVKTTKVYCRPTCMARTCREENVCYFPSAAAAAEAGFRPCLRCRPECAPGTLAGVGTQNTVARALRLIGESGLENGGVESLAERLGVGSRHLRRLFLRYVGATPSAVAQTRRLHFAKKLIDETRLPMTQVALASGFGCVRRFNDCIRKVYHRTPTHIRRLAGKRDAQQDGQYVFHLHFRPPYNWPRILEFIAARATPGVEAVEAGAYRRSVSLNGSDGYFEISLNEKKAALAARIEFGDPRSLFLIIERIGAIFDLKADWAVIARALRADPLLAPRVAAEEGTRVPGCWDGFELVTQAILGHQISRSSAAMLAGGIARNLGRPLPVGNGLTHLFPVPEVLADADLASLGVPRAKAAVLRAFARAVCDGQIRLAGSADSNILVARLCEIPGIGKSLAQQVSMRVLRDPDAFPSADPVLRRMTASRTARELEDHSQIWRPWRAYAAMLLWQGAGGAACEAPKEDRTAKIAFTAETAGEQPAYSR
jgi:AraC family transcriptional regulator, regulatory protein of adaptative response / DNA-3-methyladenine glycosylase II